MKTISKVTMLVAPVLLSLSTVGCSLFGGGEAQPPARAKPERPVVTPENRIVIMPYGTYEGKSDLGSATLELKPDQSFMLHWTLKVTGEETQRNGTFEWLKPNGLESIVFFDIREVGSRARHDTDMDKQVLTHIDMETHSFAINVRDLGTVDFKPAK